MRRQQTNDRKPATKFAHLNKKMEQAKLRSNVKKASTLKKISSVKKTKQQGK
jgi:hypothetical protein